MAQLFDNKHQGKVGDALKEHIQPNAQLSIASSRFSIYGYAALKKELARIDTLRLLLPLTTPDQNAPLHLDGLTGDTADRHFRNTLNIAHTARECANWLATKATIKAVSLPVAQNLFHITNPDTTAIAIHGSSPFTSTGLGDTRPHESGSSS